MSFLRVLRWELYKLARRPASYLGFALSLVFCSVVLIGFRLSRFGGTRRWLAALERDPSELMNGWFFANFALNIAFFSLLPLFAAVGAGSQLAGEAKEGTLRALLMRPPSRPALFGAKSLASFLWLLVQVYALIAIALGLGLLVLGGGDFLVFVWEFRREGGWIAGGGDRFWILVTTGFGAALSLFTIAALGMAASALTDNPVVAHVTTLGAFFISTVIQRLPEQLVALSVRKFTPTSHMGWWHELYNLYRPGRAASFARIEYDVKWTAAYVALFLVVGLIAFCKRDIKS